MDETTTAEEAPSKGRRAPKQKPQKQAPAPKPARPLCAHCHDPIGEYDRSGVIGVCARCAQDREQLAERVLPTLIRTGLAVEPAAAAKLAFDYAEAFSCESRRPFGGTP